MSCDQRKSILKTGGGPQTGEKLRHEDERVLSLIDEQIKPLKNQFDNDRTADSSRDVSMVKEINRPPKVDPEIILNSPPQKK